MSKAPIVCNMFASKEDGGTFVTASFSNLEPAELHVLEDCLGEALNIEPKVGDWMSSSFEEAGAIEFMVHDKTAFEDFVDEAYSMTKEPIDFGRLEEFHIKYSGDYGMVAPTLRFTIVATMSVEAICESLREWIEVKDSPASAT